jgi:hypothetical protein
LESCLGQLKREERVIVGLIAEEFTYEEISEALGRSVNALKMQVSRMRRRLAQAQS